MDFTHFIFHKVATQLRSGGMFSNHFTTNFSQNVPVKKFWKSVNIWQSYGQNFVVYFFGPPLHSRCAYITQNTCYRRICAISRSRCTAGATISTIRLYSAIHVGTRWKIQDRRQIKMQTIHKLKTTQKKQTIQN